MNILMFLYNLLLVYWSDALLVIAFVAILGVLYKRGKKDLVKEIIYSLVVKAEKEFGSTTGSTKYSQVISELYGKLPFILRLFFTKTELNKYIEDAVTWLKAKLQDPAINLLSYDQEAVISGTLPTLVYIDKTEPPTESKVETVVVEPIIKYFAPDGITELQPVTITDPSVAQ